MNWFLMGINYGLVALGIIAVFCLAVALFMLLIGTFGALARLLGGEAEDD